MNSCKACNLKYRLSFEARKKKENDLPHLMSLRASSIRRDKQKKGIPVDSNLKDTLLELWQAQQGLCYYSGVPMVLQNYFTNEYAMTVDRIIPSVGYVKGNVVLCCNIVNKIKTNLSLEQLFGWIDKMKFHLKKV